MTHIGCIGIGCPICDVIEKPGYEAVRTNLSLHPETGSRLRSNALPCIHLGEPTGETRTCPSCRGSVQVKLSRCSVHGSCTTHRVVSDTPCCVTCPDRDTTWLSINQGAGGLGDALQGLAAAKGLRQQEHRPLIYHVNPAWHPFLRLFDGHDRLADYINDQEQAVPYPWPALRMAGGYDVELRTHCARPRVQRYAANIGARQAVLPVLRDPERIAALGEDYRGAVVLCPYTTWIDRRYPLLAWLAVERLLLAAGHRTITLARHPDPLDGFHGQLLWGDDPELVTALCHSASCVVASDTGLAHLSGILGTPTLVLFGYTSPPVYAGYPRMHYLSGVLGCTGCWHTSPPYLPRECGTLCADLASIAPADVAARVEEIVCPQALQRSLLGPAKMGGLRRAVRDTRHLPGALAELGVRQGGSALAMAAAAPQKTVHLFDTWTGLPANCTDGGVHVQGEFAAPLGDVQAYLAGRRVEYHAGYFPATTAGLESEVYSCVHLDADLYQSTIDALSYFWPRLIPGGILVCDDWEWPHTPGVTRAILDFFRPDQIQKHVRHQCRIVKPVAPGKSP
jgi:O-methyltransferase